MLLLLLVLPAGFEDSRVFQESDLRPALVPSTDEPTVIGSIGLVKAAPFTVLCAGMLLAGFGGYRFLDQQRYRGQSFPAKAENSASS